MKEDDIWLVESLMEDPKFWDLTSLETRLVISFYVNEFGTYEDLCIINGKRVTSNKNFEVVKQKMTDLFVINGNQYKYPHRISKKEFEDRQRQRLISKTRTWKSYVNETSNPIRMRRTTFDFIMNNPLTKLQSKLVMYILWCYRHQIIHEDKISLKDLSKKLNITSNYNQIKTTLEKDLNFIMLNVPDGFLKGWKFYKEFGTRSTKLWIKIR